VVICNYKLFIVRKLQRLSIISTRTAVTEHGWYEDLQNDKC